jgi:hypothetical protein
VHVPAQLYLDKGVWGTAEAPGRGGVQRDEEGPAIFSRWPILSSDYLLLSRNTSDEGDTHQRLCLHAVIQLPSRALVDVYTVHLSLSEAARNRTVPEVLAFIKSSAAGQHVVLTGDMNAEPHEPALRALVAAGVILVTPTPAPTPTPLPAPPAEGAALDTPAEGAQQEAAATPQATPAAALQAPQPPAAAAAVVPVLGLGGRGLVGLAAPLKEVHTGWDGEVLAAAEGSGTSSVTGSSSSSSSSGVPLLCDTWRALYPEPLVKDSDAAARRYALTFPSDDPVKRIDMVYAGCGPLQPLARQEGGASAAAAALAPGFLWQGGEAALARMQHRQQLPGSGVSVCSHMQETCGARVLRTWLVGQDSIPGTDQGEGKGFGMTGERSAWYASDHRGVVVELELA